LVRYDDRERFGLSAQMTIRAIAKVAAAYMRDREKRTTFRAHGAMTYDERILSFPRIDRASLLTLNGRLQIPFSSGAYQEARSVAAVGSVSRPIGTLKRSSCACRAPSPPMPTRTPL
jgi:hypothetical protein